MLREHVEAVEGGLLRLSEAELLLTSLRDRYVELRDGELMGVFVGRGKKKQLAVDEVLSSLEAQVSEAELLRFNLVFQLQTFRTDMLDAVRISQRVVHVWLPEVEELYTWYRTGGKEHALDIDEEEEAADAVKEQKEDVEVGEEMEGR